MINKKKLIISIGIALGIFILASASYYFIYRLTNYNDLFRTIMPPLLSQVIKQTVFIYLITILGMSVLTCFNKYLDRGLIIVLSLITGAFVWAFMSQIVISVGIKFTQLSVIIGCLIFLMGCYFIGKPTIKDIKEMYFKNVYARIVLFSLSAFFAVFCFYTFSYDSYMYINMGEKIAQIGFMTKELISVVSGFSIFTSMFFAPAEFFGFDFAIGYYIYINFSFVVAVSYIVYIETKDKVKENVAKLLSVAAFLSIITANMFFEVMYWPLSNLIAAISLFMVIYMIYKSKQKQNSIFELSVSLFFAVCFIWTRSENSLLILIIIFLLSNMNYKKKYVFGYALISAAAVCLWYLRFFLVAGRFSEGDFLTVERALPVVLVYALMCLYLLFLRDLKIFKNNTKTLERLFFAGLALCLIGLTLIDMDNAWVNLQATIINLFRCGGWGVTTFFLIIVMFIYYYNIDEYDVFDKTLLSFIIFYFLIFNLREHSLRVGYGDSGNRYFVHLIPIIIFMVTTKLMPKLIVDKNSFKNQDI